MVLQPVRARGLTVQNLLQYLRTGAMMEILYSPVSKQACIVYSECLLIIRMTVFKTADPGMLYLIHAPQIAGFEQGSLFYIPERISTDRSGSSGHAFYTMSRGVVHSIRNEDIRCLRGSIVRKRITRTIHVTQCTCERCGHTWEVPDGRKIQRNCPAIPCRTHLWDRPITRHGVSEFAKAARPKDWAARRARGWKHPSSKS